MNNDSFEDSEITAVSVPGCLKTRVVTILGVKQTILNSKNIPHGVERDTTNVFRNLGLI
jgi:hypothetical protein